MNLLFCIDDKYVDPFLTTLYSISVNSKLKDSDIYLVQKYELERARDIRKLCEYLELNYKPIILGDNIFSHAPATKRYPETVYYRLLAHKYLPSDLEKILYVDSDILCINDLSTLYELDLGDKVFAAANHAKMLSLNNRINSFRVGSESTSRYYNSGVLLMNLPAMREVINDQDIYDYLENSILKLLMPDQDILNGLYSQYVIEIPNEIYNVDMRITKSYELLSYGSLDANWILNNSVLLHYCGTDKPWKENANSKWDLIYKHYMRRVEVLLDELMGQRNKYIQGI